MNEKQSYLAPAVKVVSFMTEKGFAGTGSTTERLNNGGSIDMGGGSSPSNDGGFFNRNNQTENISNRF